MHFFLVFWLAMNAGVYVTLRANFPGATSTRFTVGYAICALIAVVPWAALAFMGWSAVHDGLGPFTNVLWSVSIAWNISVLIVFITWFIWRPALWFANKRVDEDRRKFLAKMGWAIPGGALVAGSAGVVIAGTAPFVRKLTLHYSDLHPSLDGFKIGQFSDVHVGPFISPKHVEAGIDALNAEKVDLMVMTGDLLDDVTFMPAINQAFTRCEAKHGLIGILGNHEYYAGLEAYLRQVPQGPMKMLVDDGTTLEHNGAKLHVSGLDYPFHGMDGPAAAVSSALKKAMKSCGDDVDFKLCLAHHPTCWDAARERGIDLTLSGHTHGGQVAIGGRSIFAKAFKYMLGLYEDGERRLFVTGGLGHWFPFRLGLPPEVVVVELRRGNAA